MEGFATTHYWVNWIELNSKGNAYRIAHLETIDDVYHALHELKDNEKVLCAWVYDNLGNIVNNQVFVYTPSSRRLEVVI